VKTMQAKAYTFDDVSIVPALSELESRNDVDISTKIGGLDLKIPVLSAPMDSVTGLDMALFMDSYGGLGVIHRYLSIESQVSMVKEFKNISPAGKVAAAVGVNGDSWERTQQLVEAGSDAIVLDIAHGHSKIALDFIQRVKSSYPEITLFSASICTAQAAGDCINAGVDVLRVGVGGGSACTTRVVAGVGIPQLTAIDRCAITRDIKNPDVTIVADGGIRNSGDAVKALAAGANAVMLGGFLAPFVVSAAPTLLIDTGKKSELQAVIHAWKDQQGQDASSVMGTAATVDLGSQVVKKKVFRGMASDSALAQHKGESERYTVEGEQFIIDLDYEFDKTFTNFLDGITLGLSYVGCKTIKQFHADAHFVEITPHGYLEGTPHKGGEK